MFLIISITALQSLVSQMDFVESRLYSEDTKKTKFDMLEVFNLRMYIRDRKGIE